MTAAYEVLGITPQEQGAAFGRRLYEARMRAGFGSQYALARRMSLHKITVHKHETQGIIPRRRTLDEYAWVLGVTPQWLLYGRDDPLLDVPKAVYRYIEENRSELAPETLERLQRVPWHVIADEDVESLDGYDVHDIRKLIDRNLAKRDSSPRTVRPFFDNEGEQLPRLRLDFPTTIPSPKRGRPSRHARESAAG